MDFADFWARGYTSLVPIIPPTAPISANSTLFKRMGTPQDGRGKTPGIKGRDGNWFSWDWVPHVADDTDLERWQRMGAGIGIKTGGGIIAIDADAPTEDNARIIRDAIERHLGSALPIRVGRYPKALYLCRVTDPYSYTRIEFGPRDERGQAERVEVLSDGRMFVAHGIHPGTRQPYEWPRALVDYDDLPLFEPSQIDGLLQELLTLLPQAGPDPKLIREGATTDVNQAALRGDVQTVRRAVAATPNTSHHFPSRESYRDFGYAIKAALPDNEDEAFEIYASWCDRWEDEHGRTNDPDVYAADWRRMKGPFRVGASYLFEKAEATSGGAYTRADAWFQPVARDAQTGQQAGTTIFDTIAEQEREADPEGHGQRPLYPLLSIDDIINRPAPKWLVEDKIPQTGLGFLYSEPGVGKSFVALDMCLTIAAGAAYWHGDVIECEPDAPIVYIAAEGESGFRNRIKAWLQEHPEADRASVLKRLKVLPRTVNFMKTEDIALFLASIEHADIGAPAMVVVDTVSRAMPGADENLQKEMTLFVSACDRIRDAYQCVVLGVHHAGKSGDLRGSTVLLGAGDFVMRLSRKDKSASIVRLACEKSKDGADDWSSDFRMAKVTLLGDERPKGGFETSRVIVPLGAAVAADVTREGGEPKGGVMGLAPGLYEAILDSVETAWVSGDPWAGYRGRVDEDKKGVVRLMREFRMDKDFAISFLDGLVDAGVLALGRTPSDAAKGLGRSERKKGYQVVRRDVGAVDCTSERMSDPGGVFG